MYYVQVKLFSKLYNILYYISMCSFKFFIYMSYNYVIINIMIIGHTPGGIYYIIY